MKYVLILLLTLPSALFAQRVVEVRDADTGMPIPFARLSHAGHFLIAGDEAGKCLIQDPSWRLVTLQAAGYAPLTVRLSDKPNQLVYLHPIISPITEVKVEGFSAGLALGAQAASIARLEPADLDQYPSVSLVPAFNSLSGVRMEERSPASYRLSIRGSLMRAPFGIRNVKVYWNGIPFTEAGGSTPLNMMDPEAVGSVEVIKGPGSSLYGAGTGGVVLLSTPKGQHQKFWTEAMGGSFGTQKLAIGAVLPLDKGSVSWQVNRLASEGYREHSAVDRVNALVQIRQTLQPGLEWQLFGLFSRLQYQIPGGLTASQLEDNPRQARPGSVAQNSSILQNSAWLGTGYDWQMNKGWYHTLTVYTHGGFFDHPFILDYKRETDLGAGGRMLVGWKKPLGNWSLDQQLGAEFQSSLKSARNFGNVGGRADTLRFDDELRIRVSMVFLQTTLRYHEKWTLTTGLSVNSSVQDIYRLQDAAIDTSYRAAPSFGGVLAPRVGLAYQLGPNWSLHTSLSRGFSPPTIEEVRTNEGSINRQLRPEIGLNREIGIRGYAQKLPIEWDITLFRMDLSQTIVSYVNEDGVVLFRNSGSTRQQGLEVMWAITPLEKLTGLVRKIKVSHSLTLNQFEFASYERQGVDYSGNALTGVPSRVSVSRMAMDLGKGFRGHFTWNYTGEIPLNDANTVNAPAYHLLQARLAYRWLTNKTGIWEIYSGADNLLNETYSLGNDLNVFGGRYYQPSAARNYYMGVVWKR